MTKRLPTEFAINMFMDKVMVLQQVDLDRVNEFNYFDEYSPCHIYLICRRPRLTIDPTKLTVTKETIGLTFKVFKEGDFTEKSISLENDLNTTNIEIKSEYPFNKFQLFADGEIKVNTKVAPFIQSFPREFTKADYLDLEVLYIGQSYGVDGARTAPDRLRSHSTLQGIYSEAMSNNPDSEIWLVLTSFSQINLMMMDGRTKFSPEEHQEDEKRRNKVNDKLNWEGINEQQKINFTEAALIKYFQPRYNVIYKDSFPNPAHSTYSECYDLDINAVCIELQTYEKVNCFFYSESIPKAPWHMHNFLLHSENDRKSMFIID